MSNLFASVRLVVAIGLCLFEAYIIGIKQRQRSDESLPTSSERAQKLYSRLPTWFKQVLILACALVSIKEVITSRPITLLGICGESLLILTFFLALRYDSLHNLKKKDNSMAWLSFYIAVAVFNGVDYLLHEQIARFIAFILMAGAVAANIMTLVAPMYTLQLFPPSAEFTCDLFSFITFSYINSNLIKLGLEKESIEYEDIPQLSDCDRASLLSEKFNLITRKDPNPSLGKNLFKLIGTEWYFQGFWQFLGSVSSFTSPLALEKILIYVRYGGGEEYKHEGFLRVNIWIAVFLLFLGPFIKCVSDGQNYLRGRHVGLRVKAALIGLIYSKSLKIDLTACKESVGKLNNLISVDVSEIQSFCSYSHYMWATPLEIFLASAMLYLVLGNSAFAGISLMVLCLLLALYIGKKLEVLQERMLKNKDKRMSIMNEVLHSIRVIKFYAWEGQFADKVSTARLHELSALLYYAATNTSLYIAWEIVPALVGVLAFLTYTQGLGKVLTPSLGFTAVTLFNILRFPLSVFPEMINWYVKSRISLKRIEKYLQTADVEGLPTRDEPTAAAQDGSLSLQGVTIAWRSVQKTGMNDDDYDELDSEEADPTMMCTKSMTACIRRASSLFPSSNVKQTSPKAYLKKALSNSSKGDKQKYQLLADQSEHGVEMTIDGASLLDDNNNNDSSNRDIEQQQSRSIEEETKDNKQQPEEKMSIILEGLNLTFPAKSLVVIVGSTGSGKSSLVQGAILGEAVIVEGSRQARGDISYTAQSAWIQNATMKDNIIFGSGFDPRRYQAVLTACALDPDVKGLPAGDMTEIGEKGVNLSGGQQQRVNVARAAYSNSKIIILDDPLSAVDAHVGEHIFRQLILGFLANRTRILVTNNLSLVLPHADYVVCLDPIRRGVAAFGTKQQVHQQLTQMMDRQVSGAETQAFFHGVIHNLTAPSVLQKMSPESMLEHEEIPFDSPGKTGRKRLGSLDKDQGHSYSSFTAGHVMEEGITSRQSSTSISEEPAFHHHNATVDVNSSYKGITEKESKSTGDVALSTYWFYLKAAGGVFTTIMLMGSCLWIAVSWFIQNYYLGQWMSAMQSSNNSAANHALRDYLISVGSVVIAYIFRTCLEMYCSVRAAQRIHNGLLKAAMLAPCSWFDSTPIGRIINRFSQDISTVDSNVMNQLMAFFDCCLGTVQVMIIITWFMPLLLLPLLPVLLFTAWVTYQYLRISRELKRWESIKKSPVFVLLTETLNGLSTVRAYRQEKLFFQQCCERVDAMNQCHLYLWTSNRWLNLRMQILGAMVAGVVGMGVVYYASHGTGGVSNSAAGLALLYSLSFCDYLTWLARTHADCQMNLNSAERIEEYSAIPPERYIATNKQRGGAEEVISPELAAATDAIINSQHLVSIRDLCFPSSAPSNSLSSTTHTTAAINKSPLTTIANQQWPREGRVTFKNISLRYKSSEKFVLNNISFTVTPRSKVGMVGRTGAGKSSLLATLFRLVEPVSAADNMNIEGQLLIDGVDVLSLPLQRLRRAIAIVPQEPTLFAGSLRFNLDPFGDYNDEDIWAALARVQLADHVKNILQHNHSSQSLAASISTLSTTTIGSSANSLLEKVQVADKGSNFSVGQRQLLCMARALLKKSKVLVLDECTASVDHETDALIQEIVRQQASQAETTVICIAHRLQTVADCDAVLVMDAGQCVEYAPPHELLQREDSVFYGLCAASGALSELRVIAERAYNQQMKQPQPQK